MRKFRNNVSDGWLFGQELRLWRNFARNWDKDVDDCDFFDIFDDAAIVSKEEAKTVIVQSFPPAELEKKIDGLRILRDDKGNRRDFELRSDVDDILRDIWNVKDWRNACREMLVDWTLRLERRKERPRRRADPMEARMDEVCRVLKLSSVERDLLTYALVRARTCFDDYPCSCRSNTQKRSLCLAMAIDAPLSEVRKALSDKGRLRRYEVLDSDGDFNGHSNVFLEYLGSGDGDFLEGRFYKKADLSETLPWDYYGKLSEKHGETLKRLVAAAKGRRGANILLYGAPGTGKTSFVKTLAKELGMDLFEIRQGDGRGKGDDSPQSRMTGIRICNEQAPRGRSLMMVDEADQLLRTSGGLFSLFFGGGSERGSEKGVINSILDEIKLPTVWISNASAASMADSVRRRFDYSICFEALSPAQRRHIWQNSVEKLRLGKMVTPQMVETLAAKYPTNAGGIAMALENVKRMRPAKAQVGALLDTLLAPHCELMGVKRQDDRLAPSKDYSLDGLNIRGDLALANVVAAVKKFREERDSDADPDRPRMNLLLWGPPGTGKTEFVKHLGRETGATVRVKMGSDLLSMYVSGTEANLKRAFAEAEAENAILFLDEIDGLVQDRTGAQRSWEVTQVNELLYQMENFKGVMVGATNFMDNLDAAILRRFTFKLQFDYLDDAGKRLFFERMFKTTLGDADAARLREVRNLAPGDFRTVRQSLYYLGGSVTNAQRIDALARESEVKKDTKRGGPIGFGAR